MSRIEKLIEKFYRCPIPNDITYEEVAKLAVYFGCKLQKSGGRHPMKVIHLETGTIIPIPTHGKTVQEAYIKELKKLFDTVKGDLS